MKLYKKILFAILICLIVRCQSYAFEGRDYNIILIAIDALRADHLGCYGYFRNTSPNIDNFAKRGVLFLRGFSQATWTLPSFASMFTSKYVGQHKVFNTESKLSDSELTLAEILKIFGYKTAAFTSDVYLNKQFNLNQGFDTYEDIPFVLNSPLKRNIQEMYPYVLKWIESNQTNKFFLFLHIEEVHPPLHLPQDGNDNVYDPYYKGRVDTLSLNLQLRDRVYKDIVFQESLKIIRLKQEDKNHIIAHYDAAINYVDKYIGSLVSELERKKLTNNTIIILTSDHGVDLFDHNTLFNYTRQSPYEEIIHVPLIFFHPDINRGERKISAPAQLIDILPTVLDFLGISPKKDAEGMSLVPLIEGKEGNFLNRITYATGCDSRSKNMRECSHAVRTPEWKLIKRPFMSNRSYFEMKPLNLIRFFVSFMPSSELYNIERDPKESDNQFYKKTRIREYLNGELKKQLLRERRF